MNIEPQYETVWSGAHWRTYPQPVLAASHDVPKDARASLSFGAEGKATTAFGRALVVTVNREKARAAFTDDWQTANQLADRVGMSVQGVRRHLRDALNDGIAEAQVFASRLAFGRSERRYRRVTTRREQAA